MPTIDADTARSWISRWDAQQERYIPDREERFNVVIDVVEAVTSGYEGFEGFDRPRVVDLCCGPGSLAHRLATRLPNASVVGVDADPVLLGLGNAESRLNVRLEHADVTEPGWPERIGLDGPWDAVVSSTALHWLEPEALAGVYKQAAEHLRPGGVLINADNLHVDPALDDLARMVRERREERAGVQHNEDWKSWWNALAGDPEVGPLFDARSAQTIAHSAENDLSVAEHSRMLREAGFSAVAPVWQLGDDHVLVAIR